MISFIIVEYFSEDEINKCIESISKNVGNDFEVIVSSNSCYDKEKQHVIKSIEPNVKWIFNSRNGGFAYAMNRGLEIASGELLVIMNSDCIVNQELDRLVVFMKKHPEIGAVAPQIRDMEDNIQDTARPYVSVPRFIHRHIKRLIGRKVSVLDNKMDYSLAQTVDWIIGAFIMVSRNAYEVTRGLDENFFMYAEDLDWCTRIRYEGFEVAYFPEVNITYKGTRRARHNKKYAMIFIRSHMYYWQKWGFFSGYPKRKKIIFHNTNSCKEQKKC